MDQRRPAGTPAPANQAGDNPDPQVTQGLDGNPPPQPSTPDVTQAVNEPAPKEKVTTLGDFRLLAKLGQGGMGAVYKAHQISLDRPVALKVLAKHLADNQAFVQRFYREARIQAKLDHPHIVRGYWVGEARGMHLFAMEFIDGGSVQGWLTKLGQFPIGDALHIILSCAYAMRHAHEQNMIHRDIKPDNLLLTKKGVVKVADLGLAKALDDDLGLTQTGVGAGTPYYMAPEQARSAKNVDARADIYAMGCMLYVFLTGQMPFKGETTVAIIQAKEEGKFPSVRRVNMEVPDRLDLIISKMLASKVQHRYQTCAEMIKDLEELGLANATLSFVSSATGQISRGGAGPAPAPKTVAPGPKPQTMVDSPPARPTAKTTEEGYWYLNYTDPDGRRTTKKLTLPQIEALIKTDGFDLHARASRDPSAGFRPIGSFREFEPALRSRLTRAKAERRGRKYQGLMDEIVAADERRRRWSWFRSLADRLGNAIAILIVLGAIAGTGYLLYLFGPTILGWFGIKV